MSAFDFVRENLGKWAVALFLCIAVVTPFLAPFWYWRQPRSPGRRLLKIMLLLGILATAVVFYPAYVASHLGRMGFGQLGALVWVAPGSLVLLLTDTSASIPGLVLRFSVMLLLDVLLYAAAGFVLGFLLDAFRRASKTVAAKGSS